MSVQTLCPTCAQVTEWHKPPVGACPHCQSAYPDRLRISTEASLRHSETPTPVLLVLGLYGSALTAAMFALVFILAPFDLGNYSINDQAVSGPVFLRQAGLVFALVVGILGAIAVGLWRERAWVRPLMIAYWLLLPLGTLSLDGWTPGSLIAAVGMAAVCAGVAALYLYGRPNVVAYFEVRKTTPPTHDA
jgi:hypothetical protein